LSKVCFIDDESAEKTWLLHPAKASGEYALMEEEEEENTTIR
jgi:hypothetical protein